MSKGILVFSIAAISALAGLAKARKSGSEEIGTAASAWKSESVIAKTAAALQSTDTIATDANLKIAFIGDTGHGPSQQAVLSLIKSEGAEAVLHQGDFDY